MGPRSAYYRASRDWFVGMLKDLRAITKAKHQSVASGFLAENMAFEVLEAAGVFHVRCKHSPCPVLHFLLSIC